MLSVSTAGRLISRLSVKGIHGTFGAVRAYNGDPGPATSAHRKSQRRKLLDDLSSNSAGIGLDQLDHILDPPARPSKPSNPSTTISSSIKDVPSDRSYRDNKRFTQHQRIDIPFNRSQGDRKVIESGTGDPYVTTQKMKSHLAKCSRPLSENDINKLVEIVENAEKRAVNQAVWNMLLSVLGREGKLERMWKSYNDMKKTGIVPNARTYSTLFNAYSAIPHSGVSIKSHNPDPPSDKVLSRISTIWHQVESSLYNNKPTSEEEDLGIAPPHEGEDELARPPKAGEVEMEVPTGPINAYLKFLAKYSLWPEMYKLWKTKEDRGEKWDIIGYTSLYQGLLNTLRSRRDSRRKNTSDVGSRRDQGGLGRDDARDDIRSIPREIWEEIDSQEDGKIKKEMDGWLASMIFQTLMLGRLSDQQLAIALMTRIYELPPLLTKTTPSTLPEPIFTSLPKLTMDATSAAVLLSNLFEHPTLRSHWATYFLTQPQIRQSAETGLLYNAILSYSETNDIELVLQILDDYSSPTDGWGIELWNNALTTARWASDWNAVKGILKRMGKLPDQGGIGKGVSDGGLREKVDGKNRDVRGRMWKDVKQPDLGAKGMTIILKCALGRGKKECGEAMDILIHQGLIDTLRSETRNADRDQNKPRMQGEQGVQSQSCGNRAKKEMEWKLELAKESIRAIERIQEDDSPESRKKKLVEVERVAKEFIRNNGEFAKAKRDRVGTMKAWKM